MSEQELGSYNKDHVVEYSKSSNILQNLNIIDTFDNIDSELDNYSVKVTYRALSDALAVGFQNIFFNGFMFSNKGEKLFYNNVKKSNENKDFNIGYSIIKNPDEILGHIYSYVVNDNDNTLYIFDSYYMDGYNTEFYEQLRKSLGKENIEHICPPFEQGNSNLCAVYTTMFCKLLSEYKDFNEFLDKKDKIFKDINNSVRKLIDNCFIFDRNEKRYKENLSLFRNRKLNRLTYQNYIDVNKENILQKKPLIEIM